MTSINLNPEVFVLNNGQEIEGQLVKKTKDHYVIKLSNGSTKLKINQVKSIHQNKINQTPQEKLKIMMKEAKTIDDLTQTAEFALEHNFNHKALLLYKKAWNLTHRTNKDIEQILFSLENTITEKMLDEAAKMFNEKKYRNADKIIDQFINQYPENSKIEDAKELKKKMSSHIYNYDQTLKVFLDVKKELKNFITQTEQKKKKPQNNKKVGDQQLKTFKTIEYSIPYEFNHIIELIYSLIIYKKTITHYNFLSLSRQSPHSKKELDQSRGSKKQFNQLISANNQIYQAKKYIQQYSLKYLELSKQIARLEKQIQKEEQQWIDKGYEKFQGQWMTKEEINKSKGLVYYICKWLDPESPDYEEEKKKIDQLFKKNSTQQTDNSQPSQESLFETPKISDRDDLEKVLKNRTPQKMLKKIKNTITQEAVETKKSVTEKIDELTTQNEETGEDKKKEEKSTIFDQFILYIPIGLIVSFLLIFLFIAQSKKKRF